MPLLPAHLVLTSFQAFKNHEFFQLAIYRAGDPRARRYHPDNSTPVNHTTSGRPQDKGPVTPRSVPDTQTVFVGDLPVDVKEEEVRQIFEAFGIIICISILRKPDQAGKYRGTSPTGDVQLTNSFPS